MNRPIVFSWKFPFQRNFLRKLLCLYMRAYPRPQHHGRFDPEGLLSAVPAVVTAMFGMFTGELIRQPEEKMSGNRKTMWMVVAAVVLALVAILGDGFVPVNKKLWTLVFRVVGMNSITIYLAQQIINFGGISRYFLGGVAGLCSEPWAEVINDAGFVVVCWLFLYFLYRKKIFLKV